MHLRSVDPCFPPARFTKHEIIYTYIGPVLVVFNPFKWLSGQPADHVKACPIYSDAWKREYVGKASFEVKPHIFSTASAAYSALCDDRSDQVIIISGESGAGKTECAKQIMEFARRGSAEHLIAMKRCVAQLRPGFSLPLSAPQFHNRSRT